MSRTLKMISIRHPAWPRARLFRLGLLLMAPLATVMAHSAQQPQGAPGRAQPIEDLVNIDFRNDLRIFTVMAALNAAGFDHEIPGREMSDVRLRIRRELAWLPEEIIKPIKTFLEAQSQQQSTTVQSAYTSLALLLQNPPSFSLENPVATVPSDAQEVQEFAKLLPAFFADARMEEMWQRYEPFYIQELERYRPVVRQMIRETLEYFRIPARIVLDRKIVLIPDLLSFRQVVNARNLDRIYYVVVGPADDPGDNYRQLQHEYLHFLLDPLVEKHGASLLKSRELLNLAHQQPGLDPDYRDRYLLIVGESLVRTVQLQLQLQTPTSLDEQMVKEFRKGFIFSPYFHRCLLEFKKSKDEALPSFLATVFEGLSEKEIQKDLSEIARLEVDLKNQAIASESEQEKIRADTERRAQTSRLLSEAGQLLQDEDLPAATGKLNKLLHLDPTNGEAFFYLGQIAGLKNEHTRAYEYYEKAAAVPGVRDWVRGWSLLRMGRYLASQGDFAAARSRFEEVIKLPGELNGAREEAQQLMAQLPTPENDEKSPGSIGGP